jgi:4-methylaminobutanoate oxidase (formaldehyde-forming)
MYGHRIGASLGMGYLRLAEPVTAELLKASRIEIEVATRRIPAHVQLAPFYDPQSNRVKDIHEPLRSVA